MKKSRVDIDVNLLPEDPFFDTLIGRVMRWAVSVGRYIVIFTELIVIVSFMARFSLDRQLTDLNDSIHQKESVVKSFGDLEAKVVSVQTKMDQYQQLQQRKNLAEVFPALAAIIPQDVVLKELLILPTSVGIDGTTMSQNSLTLLINNIQLSPNFFNVSVEKIESKNNDNETEIQFKITADTEKVATTNPEAPAIEPAAPAPGAAAPATGTSGGT